MLRQQKRKEKSSIDINKNKDISENRNRDINGNENRGIGGNKNRNINRNRNKRKRRVRNLTGRQQLSLALMAIGLALILITMGMNLYASYDNRQEVASFRKAIAESPFATEPDTVQKETREQPGASAEETAIAILRIPSIECEEIVKDGSARWTLAKALGHMEGTAYPGESGNCAIAGHRNYNFGLFFNRLDEVQVEDEIILDTKEASYTYRITGIKVVEPEEMSVLDQTEDATITLITCTPLYIATHRLIVSGELVETTYR